MRLVTRALTQILLVTAFAGHDAQARQPASEADAYLRRAARAGEFSGAVLVARRGRVLLSKGYGMASLELQVPNTPRTKFRIGSLTKQFTAMAAMMLQERGKLNVQDGVCKHVAQCPPAWAGVTIHHLLTHTSGIPELLSLPDFQKTSTLPSTAAQTVERFRLLPLEFRPGGRFKYSNSGYVLLSHIIERVAGQPYEVFLRENVLAPLGMRDTGADQHGPVIRDRAAGYTRLGGAVVNAPYIDMSIPTGGGALYSTAEDLYLWDRALAARRLIGRRSYEEMLRPHATADWGDGAAYGWFIGRDKSGHAYMGFLGGINGFAAQIMRYPDEDVLVVVLSNFSFAPVSRIEADLAAIVFGGRATGGPRVR